MSKRIKSHRGRVTNLNRMILVNKFAGSQSQMGLVLEWDSERDHFGNSVARESLEKLSVQIIFDGLVSDSRVQ